MSAEGQERNEKRSTAGASVQWKGTDVCLGFTCSCGYGGHFDGRFAYFLRCTGCSQVYEMPLTFELTPVEDGGWASIQEPAPWYEHPPREGPDVVDLVDVVERESGVYAGNDRGRYEPPACPRCGRQAKVDWIDISAWGAPDRWLPGVLFCQTPGCVDEHGSSRVPTS